MPGVRPNPRRPRQGLLSLPPAKRLKVTIKRESLRISEPICKCMFRYRVIIEKDEDGMLIAKVPDLPGCATEGKTKREVMKNVREAIKAYLEALKQHGEPVPIETVQIIV